MEAAIEEDRPIVTERWRPINSKAWRQTSDRRNKEPCRRYLRLEITEVNRSSVLWRLRESRVRCCVIKRERYRDTEKDRQSERVRERERERERERKRAARRQNILAR